MASYDIREAVIQQILVSLRTVSGILAVHRDRGAIPPEDPDTKQPLLPAIAFLDGKETPQGELFENQSRRGQMPPQTINYYPEIFVVLQPALTVENTGIGEQLSAFRVAVVKALRDNASLMSLLGPNGGLAYLGFESDMQQGSDMRGQMRLDFCFSYVFDPSLL